MLKGFAEELKPFRRWAVIVPRGSLQEACPLGRAPSRNETLIFSMTLMKSGGIKKRGRGN
jgi:hypothetical protein